MVHRWGREMEAVVVCCSWVTPSAMGAVEVEIKMEGF